MTLDQLKQFRQSVYTILGKAKDALFDLMDAVLVTRSVYSFVELSVSPVFRRQWSSIYEGLEDGNPPRKELMKLYIKQLPQIDSKLGRVYLRLWCNLHFQQSPKHSRNVIQVERFDASSNRISRPLWLVWIGEGEPELSQSWRQYLRRFAIDHWYRFALATSSLDTSETGH